MSDHKAKAKEIVDLLDEWGCPPELSNLTRMAVEQALAAERDELATVEMQLGVAMDVLAAERVKLDEAQALLRECAPCIPAHGLAYLRKRVTATVARAALPPEVRK